mgnify:CR=1 FL=1
MEYLIEVAPTLRDYAGIKVEVPKDLTRLIAVDASGIIIWTKKSSKHRVRYGLQTRDFKNSREASIEFARCLEHMLDCEG